MRAHLDYIRLAAWDDSTILKLHSNIRRMFPKWRPSHWLQYTGWACDHAFYGTGEQSGRRHGVARVSGHDSNKFLEVARYADLIKAYATRIDVQITIPEPVGYNPFKTYGAAQQVKGRSCSLIHSDTGSTIYFGARTSDVFARCYQKEIDAQKFLRLEFEIKGLHARAVFIELLHGATCGAVFNSYLSKVKLPENLSKWFSNTEDDTELLLDIQRAHDNDKQLAWLGSLGNTIIRMGNDHDTGDTVRRLLTRWLEEIGVKTNYIDVTRESV